jgi:hypothetical protein
MRSGETGGAGRPEGGRGDGGALSARFARPAATVHRLPIRKNWGKEESEAIRYGVKRGRGSGRCAGPRRRHDRLLEARGQSIREPQIARETNGERADKMESSPR